MVLWVTGLSASGKTTLARGIAERLRIGGAPVVLLDGDSLRAVLGEEGRKAYTRSERLELALKYSRMSKMLADQGMTVVIATISMFREVFSWNRENISDYFEIYLDVPVEELERRDPKRIYQRYREGLIDNVAGLDLLVDKPERPDLILCPSSGWSPEDTLSECLRNLDQFVNGIAAAR